MTKKYLLLLNLIFSINIYSLSGHITFDQSMTEKDWDFMPSINNSFKSSESTYSEIYLSSSNFGLKATVTDFFLRLDRTSHPKILDLNAESNEIEFSYLFDNQNKKFSIALGRQESDDQFVECYTFSSITIGFCEDARLSISNNKEKYTPLNNSNILLLSGENNSIKLNFNSIKGLFNLYEYNLFFEYVENDFNWLTPVEEIILIKGFLYNLSYKGQKLGNIIENSLSILPQRESWNTYIIGLSTTTYYNIFNNLYFLIEPTLIFVEQNEYSQISDINKNNFKLKSGLVFATENIQISLYGEFYQNNLYGFEHISFNQRSEHHFDSNFGTLGVQLKYTF